MKQLYPKLCPVCFQTLFLGCPYCLFFSLQCDRSYHVPSQVLQSTYVCWIST